MKNLKIKPDVIFKEFWRQNLKEKIVAPDAGAMIGVMTDSDLLVQEAPESKGGSWNTGI